MALAVHTDSSTGPGDNFNLIRLEQMPQQVGTLQGNDDWTGVSSPTERRKRQNRLAQRIYRKRKESASPPKSTLSHKTKRSPKIIAIDADVQAKKQESHYEHAPIPQELEVWSSFQTAAGNSTFDRPQLTRTASICKASLNLPKNVISQFQKFVKQTPTGCMPSPMVDHLLTLVKFNVFRAFITNSTTLGFPTEEHMEDGAVTPFIDIVSYQAGLQKSLSALPESLRPTKLQCEIPHHPWIDLIPIPKMRDNLLLAGDTYDDLELCADLIGFFNSPVARDGMIVWGESWDPKGWEVSKDFLARWKWVITGCEELFDSTNQWRLRRGELPLDFRALR